jgi:hypothetical protein
MAQALTQPILQTSQNGRARRWHSHSCTRCKLAPALAQLSQSCARCKMASPGLGHSCNLCKMVRPWSSHSCKLCKMASPGPGPANLANVAQWPANLANFARRPAPDVAQPILRGLQHGPGHSCTRCTMARPSPDPALAQPILQTLQDDPGPSNPSNFARWPRSWPSQSCTLCKMAPALAHPILHTLHDGQPPALGQPI